MGEEIAVHRSNLRRTGVFSSQSVKRPPHVRWFFRTGAYIGDSPTVGDGVVYFGCNNHNIYAVDVSSGGLRWESATRGKVTASPEVANGLVMVGSNDGMFYSLEASTGSVRWKLKTDGAIVSSSATVGNRTFFSSYDGFLYCVSTETGSLIWKKSLKGGASSPPAVAGTTIFVATSKGPPDSGSLYAFSIETGEEQWRYPIKGGHAIGPVISSDMVFVAYTGDGIYGFDLRTGSLRWKSQTPIYSFAFAPALHDRLLIVPESKERILAYSTVSGRQEWAAKLKGIPTDPAVVTDGIYVGTWDGFVHKLNCQTGKEEWRVEIGKAVVCGPVPYETTILVGSEDGLFALE